MNFKDRFASFPAFALANCRLRKIAEGDAADLYAYYNNEKVYRYLDWNGPSSVEEARSIIARWNSGYEDGWIIRWAIADPRTDRIIGTIFLNGFDGKRAEVGYELAESHWRRGIMGEALRKVMEVGFGALGRNRIQACVCAENVASESMLVKSGFAFEGTLRMYETHYVTGRTKDMRMYAAFAPTAV